MNALTERILGFFRHIERRIGLAVAWACLGLAVSPAIAQGGEAGATPEPFMRSVEADDGARVQLQMAIRELKPTDPEKPTVYLAAAIHVGDQVFYEKLQEYLDAKDLVLFEGVKPPGAGADAHDQAMDDDDRARITARRLQFLAAATEMYKARTGSYPAGLLDVPAKVEKRIGDLVAGSTGDAWGREILFVSEDGGFTLTSLGADGREGGRGKDKDITYSSATDSAIEIPSHDEGIQTKLADGLGLVFQLDAMNHDGSNWRNSDMSIDQVMDRLDASGQSGDALFDALAGESFGAELAGALLGVLKWFPSMQAMVKVMIIEIVQSADEVIALVPAEMGDMMEVLIKDRNQVVLDDLADVIENEPEIEEIAIIYGAGHLPELEERITSEMGYTAGETAWLPAITVDLGKHGHSGAEVRRMREMIKGMIESQLKQLQKEEEREQRRRRQR